MLNHPPPELHVADLQRHAATVNDASPRQLEATHQIRLACSAENLQSVAGHAETCRLMAQSGGLLRDNLLRNPRDGRDCDIVLLEEWRAEYPA